MVPGSNAVGHNRCDGATVVVTAVVLTSWADEIVCAAKEVTGFSGSGAAASCVGCAAEAVLTSTASTALSGLDASVDSFDWVDLPEAGFFVGSVCFASSVLVSELVCAPPVLTTTPGGAGVVVDPVDVVVPVGGDEVVCESFGCSVVVESAGVVDDADVEDDSEGDESDVSAHAIGHP
jgi:hypothetical protein